MKNPGLGKSFLVAFVFLAALDAYVVFVPMAGADWWWRALFLVPTLALAAAVAKTLFCGKPTQIWMNLCIWLTLAVFFTILIFAIVSIIGRLVAVAWSSAAMIFDILALVLAAAWLGMTAYGIFFGWKRIVVEEVDLPFYDLPPKFDGYKIAHISDFHIGTYATCPKIVDEIVDRINSLGADMIAFTGDIVNRDSSELAPFASTLGRLSAPDGVFSVLGNHDYCYYQKYSPPHTREQDVACIVGLQRSNGWTVLLNESARIVRGEQSIDIVGVENAGSKGFPNHSDLAKACAATAPGQFKILLSHDPSHWRREVVPASDIQLTLAGHTHGMQFKLGPFTPSRLLGHREWGGIYRLGKHTLAVSTGIGGNVAFRFGVYPQILIINLVKK